MNISRPSTVLNALFMLCLASFQILRAMDGYSRCYDVTTGHLKMSVSKAPLSNKPLGQLDASSPCCKNVQRVFNLQDLA